jgi:flagellar M-ring protein FliF
VPDGTLVGDAEDGAYASASKTVNNAVGKVTERVVSAPGTVERLSVSVVVDSDAVARTDMLALQDTVSAAVGLDADRGDVVSVTQMPFDVGDVEAVAAELDAAAKEAEAAEQDEMLWNAVLAALVLIVVIATLVMGARRKKRSEPVDLGLYAPVDDLPAELPGRPRAAHRGAAGCDRRRDRPAGLAHLPA